MAIEHRTFDQQKHPRSAPDFAKGVGYTRRCAECRHFLEEHVHPHTFCRCCNAGAHPLPAEGGTALGFRDDKEYIEGAAGTIQGAEFPKHLHLYTITGYTGSIVVKSPQEEAAARQNGYFGSFKEYKEAQRQVPDKKEK